MRRDVDSAIIDGLGYRRHSTINVLALQQGMFLSPWTSRYSSFLPGLLFIYHRFEVR
jgi:hypothetical protein